MCEKLSGLEGRAVRVRPEARCEKGPTRGVVKV